MLDRINNKFIYILLSLIGVGIIGYTLFFVLQSRQQADKAYTAAQNVQVTAVKGPIVNNYYDCEDLYLKSHGESQLTCTYHGKQYAIPTIYTNDMIRGYDSIPEAVKPEVVARAQKIFFCGSDMDTSVRWFSEMKVSKISDKYFDFEQDCDSGSHFVYINTADGKWVMLGPGQMMVSCQDLERYPLPKDLFGNNTADRQCQDAVTGKKRQVNLGA